MHNIEGNAEKIPLIVQLEGVLLPSNYRHELTIHAISNYIFSIPFRIQSASKRKKWDAAKNAPGIGPPVMLFDDDVLGYMNSQRELGRDVFLISRLPDELVRQIVELVGGLSGYFILDDMTGPNSAAERAAILKRLGPSVADFELLSSETVDTFREESKARTVGGWIVTLRAALSAIRVRQWTKNILVFVPVALSPLSTAGNWFQAALAFMAFSCVASVSYIVNDLVDLQADRTHPSKRLRPFASGTLPVSSSLVIIPLLLLVGVLSSYWLPREFKLVLVSYFVMTCLYSIYLKRMLMIDVVVLGCLYATRVVAGGAATGIVLSEWLIAFSVFLFLALALVKRQAELATMQSIGRERAGNRSYLASDFAVITALASSAAFNAVTVFAVFISFETQLGTYQKPRLLWLAIPILIYWLSRMVILTSRGKMNEDPIVFAIKDVKSVICGLALLLIIQQAY